MLLSEALRKVFTLTEGKVDLKVPKTPEQKWNLVSLAVRLGELMQAPESAVVEVVTQGTKDDWKPAIEMVRDYFVMKRIPFNDRTKS
jgi:hypothetical protein